MNASTHQKFNLSREIQRLEDEVADLRAKNRELMKLLSPEIELPATIKLERAQKIILRSMLSKPGNCVRGELLAAAIDSERTSLESVKVQICRLRNKFRPFGIAIKTYWGEGYGVSPGDAEKIASMVSSS